MAAKKNSTSTPRETARKKAGKELRAKNRAANVSMSSPNIPVSKDIIEVAKSQYKKGMEKEAQAQNERESEAREVGDVSTALKIAEGDTGRRVDETPDEENLINEGLKSRNQTIGSGPTEVSTILSEASKDAEKQLEKEREARAKALDVPSADLPETRPLSETEKAERRRGVDISRARRREEARAAITPSSGPPVYRDVSDEGTPLEPTYDKNGVRVFNRVLGRGNGRGTAVRPQRGRTVPLTANDLRLSNQFWGFTPSSADTPPQTIFDIDPETGLLRGGKGTAGTTRILRTRKMENNLLANERKGHESDAELARMLADVSKEIPESVPTGEIDYRATPEGGVEPRPILRPGTAADLDPNSKTGKLLREAARSTVSGFGEMSRAGQKRPAFSGGTKPPGVDLKFNEKSPEQEALAALGKLSKDQFLDLQAMQKGATERAEAVPKEWSPSLGIHTAEGHTAEQANIEEEEATSIAEKMASGSDIGNRSIPVVTSAPELDPEEFIGKNTDELIQLINKHADELGGPQGIAELVRHVNNPGGRANVRSIQTAKAQPFSRNLTDEDIEKIDEASGEYGSPSGTHKRMKFLRRKAGVPAPATTTSSQDLNPVMGRAGQVRKIERLMQDYLGKGGGKPAKGGALGSDAFRDLGNQKKVRSRPSRSVKVPTIKNGKPTGKVESFPTGEPAYTSDELGEIEKTNPDRAAIMNPVSPQRLVRVSRFAPTEPGVPLEGEGREITPVPSTPSTLKGVDVGGTERSTRLRIVRPDTSVEVPKQSVPRAVATQAPEGESTTTPAEQAYTTVPISPSPLAGNAGSIYFPTLSGQFKTTRVVPSGTPGLGRDLYNNPVVIDHEKLAQSPAARRALNEPRRMAGIRAAKDVSAERKAEEARGPAGPGRTELGMARRAADIATTRAARRSFTSEPTSVQRAVRQDVFIQQPSVERQRSQIGAALLGKYAEDTKQLFSDNPRFAPEGSTGEVRMREGVLPGQSREDVMNKIIDQMKYSSGYVAPSSIGNVYNTWRESPTGRVLTPGAPPPRLPKMTPEEDPRDKKSTALQVAVRESGGVRGGRVAGSSVMEGDQWGAMKGAPVRQKGDRTRKPGEAGYRGLEGLTTTTTETQPQTNIGPDISSSINAQYGGIGGASRVGVANPRTTRIRRT